MAGLVALMACAGLMVVPPLAAQSIYSEAYTFSTLAGTPATSGADGAGTAARFAYPHGVAVDSAGYVYVADTENNTVRRITRGGEVTTRAGVAGTPGSADGTGSTARFNYPQGVAVDSAGNVYVADSYNHTLRKITSAGVVTTLAGLAGAPGSDDGAGTDAEFDTPAGVAVDRSGNLYVADSNNHTIRKVAPMGTNWVVTTIAGLAGASGSAEWTGSDAEFDTPSG